MNGYTHLIRDKDSNFLISSKCLQGCEALSKLESTIKNKKRNDFIYPDGKNAAAKICLDELNGNIISGNILEGGEPGEVFFCELNDQSLVSFDSIFYWISFLD